MGVQLRITGPRGAMHEPGHRPPAGRDVAADPVDLHPGQRRPPLQEPERRGDRLPMGGGDHIGDRFRAERPQQRHRLRRRERQIERLHRPFPHPSTTAPATTDRCPRSRRATASASTMPDQTQRLRPRPGPHPRRLTDTRVVLVDPQRHRRQHVLRVRQRRHRQHPTPPPTAQSATDTCQPSGQATRARLTRPSPSRTHPARRRSAAAVRRGRLDGRGRRSGVRRRRHRRAAVGGDHVPLPSAPGRRQRRPRSDAASPSHGQLNTRPAPRARRVGLTVCGFSVHGACRRRREVSMPSGSRTVYAARPKRPSAPEV